MNLDRLVLICVAAATAFACMTWHHVCLNEASSAAGFVLAFLISVSCAFVANDLSHWQ